MPFRDPYVSVTQVGEHLWELDRDLVYEAPEKFAYEIGVHAGYQTDFASVPRFLWWLVPTYGNYTAATVLHDWLLTDALGEYPEVTSRRVDEVFRRALHSLGVSFPRRWLMWAGVRWGAIANKKRRAGSLATLPGVLLISLLALPFVLPAALLLPSLVLFNLLERLTK